MKRASLLTLIVLVWGTGHAESADPNGAGYDAARWDPIHFKPAILEATDEQCLACHREVLESRVREASPAGLTADHALAWYQTLDTYQGDQETFHRRHLVTDFATQVMSLKCNTCHLGNDPREETAMSHAGGDPTLIQRKHVEPEVCLMCHGGFPYQIMAVPGPWAEYGAAFQDNCLLCHAIFRTNRHRVNYLKADAIEALAKENKDGCFGCHGGRSWYRISFPYPRNPWPGMAEAVPDWAKGRPTESEARFLVGVEATPAADNVQGNKP
ncbi:MULTISPECIES: hypothetical protein [unclassified Thiocapsa]|uniref:hypothetical protein n=1 Tax=unclassified Thiocapsa TaxID=2641286 RepID=UPI0035AF8E75